MTRGPQDAFFNQSEVVYILGLLQIAKAEEALSSILFHNMLVYSIGHIMAQMASSPFHAFMPKRPI